MMKAISGHVSHGTPEDNVVKIGKWTDMVMCRGRKNKGENTLDGPNRQLPIDSVQRTRTTLASHSRSSMCNKRFQE